MGWKRVSESYPDGEPPDVYWLTPKPENQRVDDWRPHQNWNHWRMVEEKVMEDDRLVLAFTTRLTDFLPQDTSLLIGFETMWRTYVSLDLPTRVDALLSVLPQE